MQVLTGILFRTKLNSYKGSPQLQSYVPYNRLWKLFSKSNHALLELSYRGDDKKKLTTTNLWSVSRLSRNSPFVSPIFIHSCRQMDIVISKTSNVQQSSKTITHDSATELHVSSNYMHLYGISTKSFVKTLGKFLANTVPAQRKRKQTKHIYIHTKKNCFK